MDSITVKVIDLWAAANLMKGDKMKYANLSIIPSDNPDEPASISLSAITSVDSIEVIDYDPVEGVDTEF